jgi:tetratricopeptide (TPR) repeat protein
MPNQLEELPPLRAFPAPAPPTAERPLVIGWGGSFGHREDLRAIAPALIGWLQRQQHVRFELMSDPLLAEPFAALDADRFRFVMAGSLPQYLDWLEGLDIGLAPLLPTEFNRCRSDVKFLEYASRSLVPVLQNLDPYRHLAGSGAALLFGDPDDLIRQLDRLVAEPELRQSIASTAHALVGRERQLAQHAPERLAVYRELAESTTPAEGTAGPLLQQAAERPLTALPGLQQLAPAHWRLGVASPADQQRLLGVDALQRGALAVAAEALAEAARLDPSDAHAHSFLGHALQRQGRPLDALAAFEQAASLDPLQSRPVRALARLHARAARYYAERAATLNPIDDLPQEPEGVERP